MSIKKYCIHVLVYMLLLSIGIFDAEFFCEMVMSLTTDNITPNDIIDIEEGGKDNGSKT